jgi:hypothetical protein
VDRGSSGTMSLAALEDPWHGVHLPMSPLGSNARMDCNGY